MSSGSRKRRRDWSALPCAAAGEEYRPGPGPLRDGPDISWLSRVRVGDDQGQTSACVIFSFAKWEEIMRGSFISDAACIAIWRDALRRAGRADGGLTVKEGYAAAVRSGWLRGSRGVAPATFADLDKQPLIAIYEAGVFDSPNSAGCLNHDVDGEDRGLHAVCEVAYGYINGIAEPFCYQAGSWGRRYAWQGITLMSEALHKRRCHELWRVV